MPHFFRTTGYGRLQKRRGYVLLLSVLAVGIICMTIVTSLLLLGSFASTVSLSVGQSSKALGNATACAEEALIRLRASTAYAGNQVLPMVQGTCEILPVGGIGNENRLLCTEGTVGDTVRRLQIVIQQVLPNTLISSWQEISAFTLCI